MEKVIAVVGPTASGKTVLAIELAKRLTGEIVSCDSMQVYRGMEIGTAKPSASELAEAPHHLIGVVDPETPFSVADYVPMAERAIEGILARHRVPILAGGTGLYARSLLQGVQFEENSRDEALRERLESKLASQGIAPLYEELVRLDPEAALKIHPNNKKRVLRALEYCIVTGEKFSLQSPVSAPRYDSLLLCIAYRDRQLLYDRINRRVDRMLESGLIEEARDFFSRFGTSSGTAAQAIGYKELLPYFTGEASLETAAEAIKRETRRYAKRQLTWFRREPGVTWIYADDFKTERAFFDSAEAHARQFLSQTIQ